MVDGEVSLMFLKDLASFYLLLLLLVLLLLVDISHSAILKITRVLIFIPNIGEVAAITPLRFKPPLNYLSSLHIVFFVGSLCKKVDDFLDSIYKRV